MLSILEVLFFYFYNIGVNSKCFSLAASAFEECSAEKNTIYAGEAAAPSLLSFALAGYRLGNA